MDKYTILSERGKMLIEHQYTDWHIGKGGKPIVWDTTTEINIDRFKSIDRVPLKEHLLLAYCRCNDWYYGDHTVLHDIIVREGMFEYDADVDKFTVIEEKPVKYRLLGNGTASIEAFTKDAAEYYEGLMWPNGRRCCAVARMF